MNTDTITTTDREILRRLAAEKAEIAALPVHAEKAALWTRLNDLQSERPMVWINEIPWHELNEAGELTLHCADSWAQAQELALRRELYQWRHFPGDMIVSDYLSCPLAIHNTGFGIEEDVDIVRTDETSGVVSRHFNRQIVEPADIDKIRPAIVTHDEAETEARYQRMTEVYGDILAVRREGIRHIWFTPWDNLIRWWGIEDAMLDLIDGSEMVNEAVARCVASCNTAVDQMIEQNLFSPGIVNNRVGSGGYGYASDLPGENFDPGHVLPINNWGCSNAQIFSEVSPEMHWEFALRHDIPWLERWGLNYYGCCEPLHHKMDILKRIPRLRKISMNYLIDLDRAAENIGDRYVFSYKPNPAYVAEDNWRPDLVRNELRAVIDKTRGGHIEIILKDISTVRHDPARLEAWEQLAMEAVESVA